MAAEDLGGDAATAIRCRVVDRHLQPAAHVCLRACLAAGEGVQSGVSMTAPCTRITCSLSETAGLMSFGTHA